MSFIIKNISSEVIDLRQLSPTYLDVNQTIDLSKFNSISVILNSYIFLKGLESNNKIITVERQLDEAELFNELAEDEIVFSFHNEDVKIMSTNNIANPHAEVWVNYDGKLQRAFPEMSFLPLSNTLTIKFKSAQTGKIIIK